MFNHGIATTKNDIGEIIKKDESGVITAYLLEMEKFAVIFSQNRFYTFNDTEEFFLSNFEVSNN